MALAVSTAAIGQVLPSKPDLSRPTHIAPLYFGPNALPVPDMPAGRVEDRLTIELAGDYYLGHYGDATQDIYASIRIPLFTKRVNLSIWMPVIEFYQCTPESNRHRSVVDSTLTRGHGWGDVYISTDIQLLYEKRFVPDVALRVAMKTASGGQFPEARYFDNPGYFFDLAVGKSITFENAYIKNLRVAVSGGFLCWQTDNGRQNDAFMYGVRLQLAARHFTVTETWGGYMGWEHDGDRPMTLKSTISFPVKDFEPYFTHQYGIADYPFHQFRLGLIYRIPILGNATHRRTK